MKTIVEKVENFVRPIIEKLVQFLSNRPIIIAAVLFLIALLVLIGLASWLKKSSKTFLLVVVILAIFVLAVIFIP